MRYLCMVISHCGHDADIAQEQRTRRIKTMAVHAGLADLEFGGLGRDPRYGSGWFIIPLLLLFLLIISFVI